MSYRLKTILGVALIEAILLVVLIWNSIEILTKSVEDGLTKRAVTATRLFADAAKDAVINSDISTLGSLVNKLTKNPDLTYVRVLGPNNVVLAKASALPHSIPSSFKADSSYRSTDDGVYDVFTEITEAGKKFGRDGRRNGCNGRGRGHGCGRSRSRGCGGGSGGRVRAARRLRKQKNQDFSENPGNRQN